MPIEFACSGCGKAFVVREDFAGKRGRCPQCGTMSVVPATLARAGEVQQPAPSVATSGQEPPPVPAPLLATSGNCPTCGQPLRRVLRYGHPIDEAICIACRPPRGVCPVCEARLRSELAEQCPACKASWHAETVRDVIERGPVAGQIVFRCASTIIWPKQCFECGHTAVLWSIEVFTGDLQTKDASGAEIVAGGVMGGLLGAMTVAAAGHRRVVESERTYSIPMCPKCRKKLPAEKIALLAGPGDEDGFDPSSISTVVGTSLLTRELREGCVVLTFRNAGYAAALLKVNPGRAFQTVNACLGITTDHSQGGDHGVETSKPLSEEQISEADKDTPDESEERTYLYCALTKKGKEVSGEMRARSEKEAIAKLLGFGAVSPAVHVKESNQSSSVEPLVFNCPHCQTEIEGNSTMIGQVICCPTCDGQISL